MRDHQAQHYTTIISQLPLGADEQTVLRYLITLDELFSWGHKGVVMIKFDYGRRDENGDQMFSGMVFASWISHEVMQLACMAIDGMFFDQRGYQQNRSLECKPANRGSEFRRTDNILGSARFGSDVWQSFPPLDYQRSYNRNIDQMQAAMDQDIRSGRVKEPYRRR